MLSIFSIFITELIAFRWGTAKLASIGISHDPHGHDLGGHAAHGPEGSNSPALNNDINVIGINNGQASDAEVLSKSSFEKTTSKDIETAVTQSVVDSAATQIIGVAILEFGVLLHR